MRAAMVVCQSSVERRDAGADIEQPQGTTVEVVTVLETVGRHGDTSYLQDGTGKCGKERVL